MTQEKWHNITGNIKDNFTVEDEGREKIEEDGGIEVEYIVFQGPLGKMRLELVTRPVIIDKKTTYSNRIGAGTTVEYIYSPEEKNSQLMAYKWSEEQNDWLEINAENFN